MAADLTAAAADLVARSTTAQGLPLVVEDPTVLARVAALLREGAAPKGGPNNAVLTSTTTSPTTTDGGA